jgi:Uma2 family endonuclease
MILDAVPKTQRKKEREFVWWDVPPLNTGDRLSRAEFERRYNAHPEVKHAELIEGVVYVPSPVHFMTHSRLHGDITAWLSVYKAATVGVDSGGNATVRLDNDNEPEPDALLRLDEKAGGRSRITEDDYLAGAPELVVEVAASSAAYDLYDKLRVYRRNGVQEYLVVLAFEREFRWFGLEEGEYHILPADEQGMIRSQVFPGLWLQTKLFWDGDMAGVLAVLQEGLASAEHADFVDRLQQLIQQ